MSDAPIDETVLATLAEALDRGTVREIIAMYLAELGDRIDAIASAPAGQRAAAAHVLKSASVTLGVVAMERPARRIEGCPDDDTWQHELAEMRAARQAVVAALSAW